MNGCLYRALRALGPDTFNFEIIERIPKEKLLVREKFWISFFDAASVNGFNTHKNPSAIYEKVCSDVTRQRISLSNMGKGRPQSPEHRAKIAEANRGKKHSDETKAKMSNMQKGRKHTDEHKAKVLAALTGREVSNETRAKLSASNKGQKRSDEARAKMSASAKGRKASDETRAKLSFMRKGKVSPETLEKRRQTRARNKALKELQLSQNSL